MMDQHSSASAGGHGATPISVLVAELMDAFPNERVSVADILNRLGDRTAGLLLLILALPMCIPNVPGISTLFGVLMLAPAVQLLLARDSIWLPRWIHAWTVPREALRKAISGSLPILRRIEHFVRPRWAVFVRPPAEQFLAAQTIAMAFVLLLPIPGGNWPPGITVAATGLAIANRDGRLALISVPLAAISLAIAWIGFRVSMAVITHMGDIWHWVFHAP